MKKLLVLLFFSTFCFCQSQIINDEIKKEQLQTISTKNHQKSAGLDFNISYPSDWLKTDGKRPHMLFNLSNPDKTIWSTIGISDILQRASIEEKKAIESLSDNDLKILMKETFPTSTNCSGYFLQMGVENPTKSTCRTTKIEGLESSVASTFGIVRRAEFSSEIYMVLYQVPYKTTLLNISFMFQNISNEQERFLADILSNKIMNTVVINNLWRK